MKLIKTVFFCTLCIQLIAMEEKPSQSCNDILIVRKNAHQKRERDLNSTQGPCTPQSIALLHKKLNTIRCAIKKKEEDIIIRFSREHGINQSQWLKFLNTARQIHHFRSENSHYISPPSHPLKGLDEDIYNNLCLSLTVNHINPYQIDISDLKPENNQPYTIRPITSNVAEISNKQQIFTVLIKGEIAINIPLIKKLTDPIKKDPCTIIAKKDLYNVIAKQIHSFNYLIPYLIEKFESSLTSKPGSIIKSTTFSELKNLYEKTFSILFPACNNKGFAQSAYFYFTKILPENMDLPFDDYKRLVEIHTLWQQIDYCQKNMPVTIIYYFPIAQYSPKYQQQYRYPNYPSCYYYPQPYPQQ